MAAGEVVDLSLYTVPRGIEISFLDCRAAFEGLSKREKLYAHHLGKASWDGALICLLQTSVESAGIFMLFQRIFTAETVDELKERANRIDGGPSSEEFEDFIIYVAAFYGNLGNYKSFGDTKFIPALSKEKLQKIVFSSKANAASPEVVQELWNACADRLYSLEPKVLQLGLGEEGISTYYSINCDKSDATFIQEFMNSKNVEAWNTRLFKEVRPEGGVVYTVHVASVATTATPLSGLDEEEDTMAPLVGSHEYNGCTINISRGDYSGILKRVVQSLEKAKDYASNDTEVSMLKLYIHSFNTGSIDAHKNGSRFWIRDKGPIVESYIGFIEPYRDPFGTRAEYEGFVSVVNRQMSAKFAELVARAEQLLPALPWPAAYEKDTFLRPDFTSLDVLAYGSSGIPAGINIPNYDEIRQGEGFKNVSLGNVLAANSAIKKVTFLNEEDQELYGKLKAPSFEVQVGLHELLGHGSGKLFVKNKDGSFNFDIDNVKHTETEGKIASWYTEGETWNAKFAEISASYEECRAECVGIYMCTSDEVLRIFGHTGTGAEDIAYINWLNMVRAGLMGLEFYTPETKTWRQAHMQARFVILRVLLEAGESLVTLTERTGEDGKPDLVVTLDRSKIKSVGRPAIAAFLRKLQVYKSTADYEGGKALYGRFSKVDEAFLAMRKTVLERKTPRRLFAQAHTETKDDSVVLTEFESSARGLIGSFVTRFPAHDVILDALWRSDRGGR